MKPGVLARGVAWIALLSLVGLTVYGLWSRHLFGQRFWEPGALRRLIVAGIFWAIFTLLFRKWMSAATVIFVAGYTVFVVGPMPLVGAVLFVAGAYAVGRWVVEDALLAIAVGSSLLVSAMAATAAIPIHTWWVWGGLLLGAIGLRWRDFRLRPLPRFELPHSLLLFALLLHWLVAMKPEVSADGLAMHLSIPTTVGFAHRWDFDVTRVAWAVMPMDGDWAYTIAYLVGGEFASKLVNFAFLAVTAWLTLRVISRCVPLGAACLLVSLFVTTPLVQLETGSMFIENLLALTVLGGLVAVVEGQAVAAGILLGTAAATKFAGIAFAVPLLLLSGRRWWKAAGLFVVFGCPPYVTAWIKTGNPVFPFSNHIFQSPLFDTKEPFRNLHYLTPLSWRTLFDYTFESHRFLEGLDGSFGFWVLVFLPVSLVLWRRSWPRVAWMALLCAVVGCLLVLPAQSYLRYIYPALPLLVIVAAAAVQVVLGLDRRLYLALMAAAAALIPLQLYFLPSSNWYHHDFTFRYLAPMRSRFEYVEYHVPERRLIAYLNREPGPLTVAFLEGNPIAGLRHRARTNSWHDYQFWLPYLEAGTPDAFLDLARRFGVTYFIGFKDDPDHQELGVRTRKFLWQYTVPLYAAGRMQIYKLKDEGAIEEARKNPPVPPAAKAGVYDDSNWHLMFTGPWPLDTQFAEPMNGTVTYCNQAGGTFSLRFEGTGITWVHTKAGNRGKAEVFLDGVSRGVVDLYSPAVEWRQKLEYGGLAEGEHTIEVRVLGEKVAASGDTFVDVDALIVE